MDGFEQSLLDREASFIVERPRTLDDLPMQHSQQDALDLLQQKRHETHARRLSLRSQGGEFLEVSRYSRRRFDSAVSSRGEAAPPAASPQEAALFYQTARPAWSLKRQGESSSRPRPYSVTPATTATTAAQAHHASAGQRKPRPDSEPLYGGSERRGEGVSRVLNHARWQRTWYPEIHRLVQRYNTDMRVVCGQAPAQCESSRRHSKDLSVASGFFLVPLRQEEEEEEAEEETQVVNGTHHGVEEDGREGEDVDEVAKLDLGLDLPLQGEVNRVTLQQGRKNEDRLGGRNAAKSTISPSQSLGRSDASGADSQSGGEEEANSGPWRCWVDDATVSTVHSRAPSEAASPEDGDADHHEVIEPAAAAAATSPASHQHENDTPGPVSRKSGRKSNRASAAISEQTIKPATPGAAGNAATTAAAAATLSQRDKKGKKTKKEEALPEPPPPPPPPVEEPPMVVEEVLEEPQPEPEPEPEPVPPSYICPSSETKSHKAEIRRWISQSPFRAAGRTMPIF